MEFKKVWSQDSSELMQLDLDLQKEYDEVMVQEELFWYQKSKENWVQFRDQNTKFFYTQILVRRKRNRIHGLFLDGGAQCIDLNLLEEEAIHLCKNLFSSDGTSDIAACYEVNMPILLNEERMALTALVTLEEVRQVGMSMKPFKAPRSDGFHAFFYKNYWDVVGIDVCRLVQFAFMTGTFNLFLADTLLALIPKVDNPNYHKNFRPISRCNVIYKIVTKVLVNCLWPIPPRIVSLLLGSFILRRGTSDNIIVAQEVIHWMDLNLQGD